MQISKLLHILHVHQSSDSPWSGYHSDYYTSQTQIYVLVTLLITMTKCLKQLQGWWVCVYPQSK